MTINAKEKIINKIDELLPMDSAVSSESYRDDKAIELFYRLPYFFNVRQLLDKYNKQYAQYGIDSYTYSNGLIKLKSYYSLNSEYVIEQTIITDSLESDNAIIHIWNKHELKALQQFFIKSESASSIFGFPNSGNVRRNIETNETEVEIENMVIGRFSRINKNNSETVYAEKYMPINRITDWNLKLNDIFSNVELEVLYCYNDVPVFAQLLDDNGKSLLEGTPYNPNNYRHAEILTESVINEVEAIVKEIATIIDEYGKGVKENENNLGKNNWIKKLNQVSSRLTREKSIELIAAREQIIQDKMRKIEEKEYQSEVQGMLEDENYADEEWNMVLGPGGSNLEANDFQKKMFVKKASDTNKTNK